MILFGEHARELVTVELFFEFVRAAIDGLEAPCFVQTGALWRTILNSA